MTDCLDHDLLVGFVGWVIGFVVCACASTCVADMSEHIHYRATIIKPPVEQWDNSEPTSMFLCLCLRDDLMFDGVPCPRRRLLDDAGAAYMLPACLCACLPACLCLLSPVSCLPPPLNIKL
jgi:hypothetical protein